MKKPARASGFVRTVCGDIVSRPIDGRMWLRAQRKLEERLGEDGVHFYVYERFEERRSLERVDGMLEVKMGEPVRVFRRQFQSIAQAMKSWDEK